MVGVKRALSEAPREVIAYAKSRGYGEGLGVIPPSSHILEPELEPELEPKGAGQNPANLISELIKNFSEINPACKRMYNNKTQRAACKDLIETYGFDRVQKIIVVLPKTNKQTYFPTITTPKQLWDKYQSLHDGIAKLKGKGKEII